MQASFKLWFDFRWPQAMCVPFIDLVPLSLSRTAVERKAALEVLSLAMANTQLFYGAASLLTSMLMYRR